jgi:hypothetical protein
MLKNAVNCTPRKGKIHITSLHRWSTRAEVHITDNSAGITPEMLPGIFDAFEEADFHMTRQFGGLGLGLAKEPALTHRRGSRRRRLSSGNAPRSR